MNDLGELKLKIKEEIAKSADLVLLEKTEKKYLGRKQGELTQILRSLKDLPIEKRKEIGQAANFLKREIEEAIKKRKKELGEKSLVKKQEFFDITLPTKKIIGHFHPITQIKYEIEDVFRSMGFLVLEGPEIESDWYNFEALNVPPDHPAREMQDTFYIKSQIPNSKFQTNSKFKIQNSKLLLRTHTSAMQVRALEQYGAPLRAIFPGRCFRYEATDASHETTFWQIEGLMVDKNISIANLIAVMKILLKIVFKKEVEIRLRPGYFPFVEPGFELDMKCFICEGYGCSVCKEGWLEIMPCGLVHPNVLKAAKIDPKKFTGFAFGLGLTRLVMMKYRINDVRLFNSSDLRFLKQF